MEAEPQRLFIDALLTRHPDWRQVPLLPAQTEPRSGVSLIVPAPLGSDLHGDLIIEEDEGEVTVDLDYSHIHLYWPFQLRDVDDPIWRDPLALIDAVLAEKVVSSSGWINGQFRVGSLHDVAQTPNLLVRNLEHIRVRSWLGTYNQDHFLQAAAERS